VALVVAACGAGAPPAVSLPADVPAVESRPSAPVTLLGDCRVIGSGERRREGDDGAPFEVFGSNEARVPAFVIARPEHAHVVWSHFPARADDGRTRARVDLGGQEHVRYSGYADLYGRTFTITTRMDSVAGHLWARAGAPADVMAATAGGDVYVRVPAPFEAPRTIVVKGNCGALLYDPDVPDTAPNERAADVVNASRSFELFASPTSARPFTTVTLAPEQLVSFQVFERRAGFVRVGADEGYVVIDAWVPASEVVQVSGRGVLRPLRPTPATFRFSGAAHVERDTPLYVGDPPEALRGAVVERNASVLVDARWRTTIEGRAVVAFAFADGLVVAPEGSHLWIAEDAVRGP